MSNSKREESIRFIIVVGVTTTVEVDCVDKRRTFGFGAAPKGIFIAREAWYNLFLSI